MPPVTGTLNIRGDDPRTTTPTFANFLAISNVGSEVQFEFIFVDISQLALRIQAVKDGTEKPDGDAQGRTVAKLVMPVASFVQLKTHLAGMFERLEAAQGIAKEVAKNESGSTEKTRQERGYAQ